MKLNILVLLLSCLGSAFSLRHGGHIASFKYQFSEGTVKLEFRVEKSILDHFDLSKACENYHAATALCLTQYIGEHSRFALDGEELDFELFDNRHNYHSQISIFKDEDLNEAMRLINEGANINTQSDCGINILMIAVKKGKETIVESLLNNKKDLIDLNLQDNHGYTALISAAVIGNKEIVKLLLACPNVTSPIDLNLKTIKTKETALMKATARGYMGVIELLSTCSNDKAAIDLHIKNKNI